MPSSALGLVERHVGRDRGAEVAAVRAVALVARGPCISACQSAAMSRVVSRRRARGERRSPGSDGITRSNVCCSRSTSGSSSMNALGQPWVRISGMPPPADDGRSGSRTPSTSATNCGQRFSSRSCARQSKPLAASRRPAPAGRRRSVPCSQASPGAAPGQRVRSSRSRRSSSTASSIVDRESAPTLHQTGTLRHVLVPIVGPGPRRPLRRHQPDRCARPRSATTSRAPATASTPRCTPPGFTPRPARARGGRRPAGLRRRHHQHRRPPDPRRGRAQPRGAARRRRGARGARAPTSSPASSRSSASPPTAPRSAAPKATMGLQPETIGGRPVWILPNPSGLNAHYKPADFARLYAEARAYARRAVLRPAHPLQRPERLVRRPRGRVAARPPVTAGGRRRRARRVHE